MFDVQLRGKRLFIDGREVHRNGDSEEPAHRSTITRVKSSPDQKTILSIDTSGVVMVWDRNVHPAQCLWVSEGGSLYGIENCHISNDRSLLVVVYGHGGVDTYEHDAAVDSRLHLRFVSSFTPPQNRKVPA